MGIGKNLNDGLRSRRGGAHITTQRTVRQEVRRTITEEVTVVEERFDLVGWVIDYESGNLTEDEIVTGFKHLIRTGLIHQLQGHYQRAAQAYINNGVAE